MHVCVLTLSVDTTFAFTRTLLLGLEYDLVILLLLFYACVDFLFNNTFASIVSTYIVDRILVAARHHWGKLNMARKTLIDERFLI